VDATLMHGRDMCEAWWRQATAVAEQAATAPVAAPDLPGLRGRRTWIAAALGAAWLPAPAVLAATPGIDAPPEPAPPRGLRLPPMVAQRLGNGLTVITVPRPGLAVVSARLLLRVGHTADPAGRPGVAGLTAGLLSRGARRGARTLGAAALAREAEAMGSGLATDIGWRRLSVAMSVVSQRLPAALSLMADVLRRPVLAEEEFERVRAQSLDGLRLSLASPAELAAMVLKRAFWGDSVYGAVTTPAALERLAVDDLRQFHRLHARPELAALVLAGDITPERAALLAQQVLGDWSPVGALVPAVPLGPARPRVPPLVLVHLPGSGQSAVQLAVPSAASTAPDRLAALLCDAVLGGGYSSRMNAAVRIRRGLSYGAFTDLLSYPSGGMLAARTQVRHADAAQVLALMRAEFRRLVDEPPGADELAARQASLVGAFARQLQTIGGLADLAQNQWVHGRPLHELQTQAAELLALTPEQVQAHARRYWADAEMQAVVVGDIDATGATLAPAAPLQALRLAFDRLDLEQPGLQAPPGQGTGPGSGPGPRSSAGR
jgi:zinc protease